MIDLTLRYSGEHYSITGLTPIGPKDRPTVVDVGKALKNYYEQNSPWADVQKYLDCVYDLEDPNRAARRGRASSGGSDPQRLREVQSDESTTLYN